MHKNLKYLLFKKNQNNYIFRVCLDTAYCWKLKIEHCSKIIFKYVNNTIRTNFKIIFLNKPKIFVSFMNNTRDPLKNVRRTKPRMLVTIQTFTKNKF